MIDWILDSKKNMIAAIIGLLAIIGVVAMPIVSSYATNHTATVTVCKTEKVAGAGNTSGHNFVYTSDGPYTYDDYAFPGVGIRTDSLTGYTRLQSGKVYEISYFGWRNGFTSSFSNIKDAKMAPPGATPIGSCE